MAFEKKFELGLIARPQWEVAGHMADNWAKHLGEAGELIKDKLDEKMPDDGTFMGVLVEPAVNAYAPVLDPSFVSKSERSVEEIRNVRREKLERAFNKWKDNMTKAFATVDGVPAKFFKDKVSSAKDLWAMRMAYILAFNGDKIRGRGLVPITAYYLVGDGRASSWVEAGDLANGEPYNIARSRERTSFKAALLNRLLQGGMMIVKSQHQAAEILAQNQINAALLTGLRDPAKCDAFVATPAPDKCFCSWEMDADGRLVLRTQIGLTV